MSALDVAPEERHIVEQLEAGPIHNDDGSISCRVCSMRFERHASYGPHWRRAHFVKLSKSAQLVHVDAEECTRCGLVVTSMANHLRNAHPKPKRRETSTEIAVVEHDDPVDDDDDEQPTVATATDAGLAILAGLRPGSTLRVEELPDVVEWLAETERVVALFKR